MALSLAPVCRIRPGLFTAILCGILVTGCGGASDSSGSGSGSGGTSDSSGSGSGSGDSPNRPPPGAATDTVIGLAWLPNTDSASGYLVYYGPTPDKATTLAVQLSLAALDDGTPDETVYISDLPFNAVSNGWGPVERDMSNGEQSARDGGVITLSGQTYTKGLGVHASSEVQVSLGGRYQRFISDVGLDEETAFGTVRFEVWTDGVLLYQSPIISRSSATQAVDVDVSGRQNLVLIVKDGGDGVSHDHADWAGARLIAGAATLPSASFNAGRDLGLNHGDSVCFRLRAYNAANVLSDWSDPTCGAI